MVFTNLLLVFLIIILIVSNRNARKNYLESKTMLCDVDNVSSKVSEDKIDSELESYAEKGYRLCGVTYSGYSKADKCHYYRLFFTKYGTTLNYD